MTKRMILSALLAFATVPALASDASYDVRSAVAQTSASATPTQKEDSGPNAQGLAKHDCSCHHHHS